MALRRRGFGLAIPTLAEAWGLDVVKERSFLLMTTVRFGGYLAVDWALMTEVIPLASSGRFMGLANVANSLATPVGLVFAGITIDYFTRAGNIDTGPRAGVALGIPMLIGAAIILIGVRPRRDPRLAVPAAA
jgi:hypothetical protein